MSCRVLVVDDDAGMCDMLQEALGKRGHVVEVASGIEPALAILEDREIDVVLTDLKLAGESGLVLCRQAVELRPDVPVIVITAFGSMKTAVAAIRSGAYDFVTKPVDLDQLALIVKRAGEHHQLRREVHRLKEAARRADGFGDTIGDSPAMRRVYDLIERISDSDASVLITGESGTGKELVARALHESSARRHGRFVPVNCAAISAQLLESELFGHVKGAFTDAKAGRAGLFVDSSGGTLFLDEIGEMPTEMQSKLLRALQERKVRPVGGSGEMSFDTRVIAATNRDIDDAVESGRFRQDLLFRVDVVRIAVPPLRARGNDVLLLAQHFIERHAERSGKRVTGIIPEAAAKLLEYEWPGNVRELENVMARAVALTRFDQIMVDDLPDRVKEHRNSSLLIATDDPSYLPTLEELERRYVDRVLSVTAGNKTQAAKVLGVDRRTLYRKLERYERDGDD